MRTLIPKEFPWSEGWENYFAIRNGGVLHTNLLEMYTVFKTEEMCNYVN